MLFPLRVEEAEVDRLPVVSLGIAAICAVAFVLTWVIPADPGGGRPQAMQEILKYYQKHPYLELQPAFVNEYLPSRAKEMLEQLHEDVPIDVDEQTRGLEQRHLDSLTEEFQAEASTSALRRFALVPARGAVQPGWLTAMFLHFGWAHILGNFFFFYLVGPLLEDLWGRVFFGGFYLAGGIAAALAHFALDPGSTSMMAGASGAIAACMGAFTYRCAHRKIRMAYMFSWFWRGTFLVPAWLWGAFYFAMDVFSFATHSSGGVAVMAHIGGFLFGFGAAVALKKSGYEADTLAPAVESKTTWKQHPGIDAAREALERGDKLGAAASWRSVLRERPDDREALVGLARFEGDARRVEPLLSSLLARGDGAAAWDVAAELGEAFDPDKLSEKIAWQLASSVEAAPEGMRPAANRLDAAVGKKRGPLAAKALLRAARRSIAAKNDDEARAHVEAARGLPALLPEMSAQIEALAAQVGLAEQAPRAEQRSVRILSCRVLKLGDDGIELESTKGQRKLRLDQLAGIAAGVVPTPQGASILTDLIISFGEDGAEAAAIRISGTQLSLPTLFPGVPAKEAYSKFLAHLLQKSFAVPLPSREALERGEYPRFESIAALNAAFYGTRN